jgi:hypothetical protein
MSARGGAIIDMSERYLRSCFRPMGIVKRRARNPLIPQKLSHPGYLPPLPC